MLWQSLERVIPDIRDRAELVQVGTPLTHERFLNRYRGTYGPAISAASGTFPGPSTPIKGLYRCALCCAYLYDYCKKTPASAQPRGLPSRANLHRRGSCCKYFGL